MILFLLSMHTLNKIEKISTQRFAIVCDHFHHWSFAFSFRLVIICLCAQTSDYEIRQNFFYMRYMWCCAHPNAKECTRKYAEISSRPVCFFLFLCVCFVFTNHGLLPIVRQNPNDSTNNFCRRPIFSNHLQSVETTITTFFQLNSR